MTISGRRIPMSEPARRHEVQLLMGALFPFAQQMLGVSASSIGSVAMWTSPATSYISARRTRRLLTRGQRHLRACLPLVYVTAMVLTLVLDRAAFNRVHGISAVVAVTLWIVWRALWIKYGSHKRRPDLRSVRAPRSEEADSER